MQADHIAHTLANVENLVARLAELEVQAKAERPGAARRELEERLHTLRLQLLREADPSAVCLYLSASEAASADQLRSVWQEGALEVDALARLRTWGLDTFYRSCWQEVELDLAALPRCSFFLRFTFTLTQPYLSRDDKTFYIIDNPIVRDKVFGLPMVRPSSWKGNLRAALWQLGYQEAHPLVGRLFGEIRANDTGQAGRLIFFPTFFNRTGLEIINPHDRQARVGRNPILFESVPPGAEGSFTLLYVPLDRIGESEEAAQQLAADLPLVAQALQAMFRIYGFSAKRTSGFGLANEVLSDGRLALHLPPSQAAPAPAEPEPPAPPEPLPGYLIAWDQLRPEYLNPDGTFRERSQAELERLSKRQRQPYDKARAWWERQQAQAAEPPPEAEPPAPETGPQEPPLWEKDFASFSELVEVAGQVAGLLAKGGGR